MAKINTNKRPTTVAGRAAAKKARETGLKVAVKNTPPKQVWMQAEAVPFVKPTAPAASGIEAVLTERGSRYGAFKNHAAISQDLQDVMRNTPNWSQLEADQKEALQMIQHKVARILNGDASYIDSWTDISGYATLVEKRLTGIEL